MRNTHIKNVEKDHNGGTEISTKGVEPSGRGVKCEKRPIQTGY